ncbi:hypothetical protein [Enterococcus lactis]|uniref:hypothetical protein n=1 Tax=Enterococcus lactis TaxID=357441 RepID=UPI002A3CA250|nr:hypothetical protein [Enterococcus lactis]
MNDYAPEVYMNEVMKYTGTYGNEMKGLEELKRNLEDNAIPELVKSGNSSNYLLFLKERAVMMSLKIKEYYEKL